MLYLDLSLYIHMLRTMERGYLLVERLNYRFVLLERFIRVVYYVELCLYILDNIVICLQMSQ